MKTKKTNHIVKVAKIASIMGMSALLLTSCGKKNAADPNANNQLGPVFTNQQVQNDYNAIKAQYPCDNGQTRVADIPLHLPAGVQQGGFLGGSLNPGHAGGTAIDTFIGVNYGFKDLLVVTRVSNGGQISYNFTLSLCSQIGQSGIWFIGGDAQLTNFQAQGVMPVSSMGCSFGNVDSGNIAFNNSNFGMDGRSFTRVCWQ